MALGVFVTAACGGRSAPVVVPTAPAKAPQLAVTRFVAFGDSLTEGFVQVCEGSPPVFPVEASAARARLGVRGTVFSTVAYPNKLQGLLAARYPGQAIDVVNEGVGGEDVRAGAADFSRVLVGGEPTAVLLLEGVNNINARQAAAIPDVVSSLRGMVQAGRSRGFVVFVGTLLPQREGGCRAGDYADGVDDIVAANVLIRSMVGSEGAILVDLYRAFVGRTAILLGADGLHPSAAGYEAMAEAFSAAISGHLEQ